MSAGAALFALLSGQTSAGTRVTPLLLPQEPSYPAITYQQLSSVPTHAMGADSPVTRARVQLDSFGETYKEARTLANEVLTRINRYRGTIGGVTVLDILLNNEIELYESETQVRRVMQDYSVLFTT